MDCQFVGAEQPLRQGDILKRISNDASAYRVVVTADCDIAQNKGVDKGVACAEVVRLRDYLTGPFAIQLLRKKYDWAKRELSKWIQAQWRRHSPGAGLDPKAVDRWLDVAPVEEIEATLQVEPQPEDGMLRRLLRAIQAANECFKKPHFDEIIECLQEFQDRKPADPVGFLKSQLTRLQPSQLPDDLFFISELPGEDGLGYLASLRNLSFIDRSEIVSTVPEARSRGIAYVRIGRLAPTFKHGMAQQLGILYSRIGYPEVYEETRDVAFTIVIDEICSKWGCHD